jgi:hypothetical protein
MIVFDSEKVDFYSCNCSAPTQEFLFYGQVIRSNFMIRCPICQHQWWIRPINDLGLLATEITP